MAENSQPFGKQEPVNQSQANLVYKNLHIAQSRTLNPNIGICLSFANGSKTASIGEVVLKLS